MSAENTDRSESLRTALSRLRQENQEEEEERDEPVFPNMAVPTPPSSNEGAPPPNPFQLSQSLELETDNFELSPPFRPHPSHIMSSPSSSHIHIDLPPHPLVDPQEPSTSQGSPHSSLAIDQTTDSQLDVVETREDVIVPEVVHDNDQVPQLLEQSEESHRERMSQPSYGSVSVEQLMEMSIQQRIQQEAATQRQMEEAENRSKQLAISSKAMKVPTLSGGDTTSDTQSQSDDGQKVPRQPHPLLISQRAPPSRDAALSTVSSTESEPDQLAPGTKYESKRPPQKVPVLKRAKREKSYVSSSEEEMVQYQVHNTNQSVTLRRDGDGECVDGQVNREDVENQSNQLNQLDQSHVDQTEQDNMSDVVSACSIDPPTPSTITGSSSLSVEQRQAAIQSSSESDGSRHSRSSDYPPSTSTSLPGGNTVSDISNTTIHSSSHSNKVSDTQSDQELSGESQPTSQTLPIPLFSSTPTESELDATPSSSVMPPPACPPPKKSSSDETTATSSSGDYWYKTKVFNTLQRDQSGSSLEDHSGREQLPTIMEVQDSPPFETVSEDNFSPPLAEATPSPRNPIAAAIDQNNVIPSTPSLEDMETQVVDNGVLSSQQELFQTVHDSQYEMANQLPRWMLEEAEDEFMDEETVSPGGTKRARLDSSSSSINSSHVSLSPMKPPTKKPRQDTSPDLNDPPQWVRDEVEPTAPSSSKVKSPNPLVPSPKSKFSDPILHNPNNTSNNMNPRSSRSPSNDLSPQTSQNQSLNTSFKNSIQSSYSSLKSTSSGYLASSSSLTSTAGSFSPPPSIPGSFRCMEPVIEDSTGATLIISPSKGSEEQKGNLSISLTSETETHNSNNNNGSEKSSAQSDKSDGGEGKGGGGNNKSEGEGGDKSDKGDDKGGNGQGSSKKDEERDNRQSDLSDNSSITSSTKEPASTTSHQDTAVMESDSTTTFQLSSPRSLVCTSNVTQDGDTNDVTTIASTQQSFYLQLSPSQPQSPAIEQPGDTCDPILLLSSNDDTPDVVPVTNIAISSVENMSNLNPSCETNLPSVFSPVLIPSSSNLIPTSSDDIPIPNSPDLISILAAPIPMTPSPVPIPPVPTYESIQLSNSEVTVTTPTIRDYSDKTTHETTPSYVPLNDNTNSSLNEKGVVSNTVSQDPSQFTSSGDHFHFQLPQGTLLRPRLHITPPPSSQEKSPHNELDDVIIIEQEKTQDKEQQRIINNSNIAEVSPCPPATDTPTTGSMVTPLTPGRLSRSPRKSLSLRRQRSTSDSDLKSPPKRKKQDDEQNETESNVNTLPEHEGPISESHSQENRTDSQIRMESQDEAQEKITESQDNKTKTQENRTESQVNENESDMETSDVLENEFSVPEDRTRNESSNIQTGNEDAIHHESNPVGNNQLILVTDQTTQESFVPHLSSFVLGTVGGEQEEEGGDQFNDSCQFEMPVISAIVESESEISQLSTFDFNLQKPDVAKSSVVVPPVSSSRTVPPSSALFARPMLIPSSGTRTPIDEEKDKNDPYEFHSEIPLHMPLRRRHISNSKQSSQNLLSTEEPNSEISSDKIILIDSSEDPLGYGIAMETVRERDETRERMETDSNNPSNMNINETVPPTVAPPPSSIMPLSSSTPPRTEQADSQFSDPSISSSFNELNRQIQSNSHHGNISSVGVAISGPMVCNRSERQTTPTCIPPSPISSSQFSFSSPTSHLTPQAMRELCSAHSASQFVCFRRVTTVTTTQIQHYISTEIVDQSNGDVVDSKFETSFELPKEQKIDNFQVEPFQNVTPQTSLLLSPSLNTSVHTISTTVPSSSLTFTHNANATIATTPVHTHSSSSSTSTTPTRKVITPNANKSDDITDSSSVPVKGNKQKKSLSTPGISPLCLIPDQKVVARWKDGRWYAGTLCEVTARKILVEYLDGDRSNVLSQHVLPLANLPVGVHVCSSHSNQVGSYIDHCPERLTFRMRLNSDDSIISCDLAHLILTAKTAEMSYQMVLSQQEEQHRTTSGGGSKRKKKVKAAQPSVMSGNVALFYGISFLVTKDQTGNALSQEAGKREEIETLIRMRGGFVMEDYNMNQVIDKRTYCLSNTYCRTVKYLIALAANIPCVSYNWIKECVKQDTVLDYTPFLLPAGLSSLSETLVSWKPRSKMFLHVLVFILGDRDFKERWERIVQIAGATCLKSLRHDTTGTHSKLIIITKKADPPPSLRNGPLPVEMVSVDWLVECLLEGKVLPTTSFSR